MSVSRRAMVLVPAALSLTLVLSPAGVLAASSASADAPSGDYAAWTLTGSSGNYRGTVSLATGFPATTVTTDSRTPPAPAVATGASVWLPAGTAFGAQFGSSQGQPYVNLRPRADNASAPSTTTYTFASGTPTGSWGFTLGDIDAERLTVTAVATDGTPVPAAGLGYRGAYNYCDASPRSSSCSGRTSPYPLPTATTGTDDIALADPSCPADPARCDTQGAAAWFTPRVALRSLTVTSTWKQGFPSYQTWFAAQRSTLTGRLDADCGTAASRAMQLLDTAGHLLATTTTSAAGGYTFGGVARGVRYEVRPDPAGLAANESASTATVRPEEADTVVAPLAVTSAWTVRGHVDGTDTADLVVELLGAGGTPVASTRTDGAGDYTFEDIRSGAYSVRPVAATGNTVQPADRAVDVACADPTVASFTQLRAGGTTTPPPSSSSSRAPTASPTGLPTGSPTSSASVAPTAISSVPPGALATTGTAVWTPLPWALALLVTGAGCLTGARRRPRRH